jgi:hypothetical protein
MDDLRQDVLWREKETEEGEREREETQRGGVSRHTQYVPVMT